MDWAIGFIVKGYIGINMDPMDPVPFPNSNRQWVIRAFVPVLLRSRPISPTEVILSKSLPLGLQTARSRSHAQRLQKVTFSNRSPGLRCTVVA